MYIDVIFIFILKYIYQIINYILYFSFIIAVSLQMNSSVFIDRFNVVQELYCYYRWATTYKFDGWCHVVSCVKKSDMNGRSSYGIYQKCCCTWWPLNTRNLPISHPYLVPRLTRHRTRMKQTNRNLSKLLEPGGKLKPGLPITKYGVISSW